jgi:hypothetical protein
MKMTQSPLPEPGITFRQSRRVDFFPFYGRDDTNSKSRILCLDTAGQAVLYDADSHTVETLPCLHEPKGSSPMALSVRRPDAHDPACPEALYVMDIFRGNFEALVYGDPATYLLHPRPNKFVWRWHQLPPPPFADDPERGAISSFIVLDDNRISVSTDTDIIGTYYFNAADEQWTKAGWWLMPFYGRAQLVPELNNLCFGVAKTSPNHFCAMDLSSGRRRKRLRHQWPHVDTPLGWEMRDASMAYLGAGKFCIAKTCDTGDEDNVILLTGVEVVHKKGGKTSELQMIRHRSNCYSSLEHGIRCVL